MKGDWKFRGAATAFVLVAILVASGVHRSFATGAPDFNVFHYAWNLMNAGRSIDLYYYSPDRFLYAPGFAWLLAPLGRLDFTAALVVWSVAKLWCLGAMIRVLIRRCGPFAAALGVLFFARPLLTDFRYGQVNLLIVATCVWALDRYAEEETSPAEMFMSWFFLALAAFAKLYPGPFLIIPFIPGARVLSGHRRFAMAGALVGAFAILAPPYLFPNEYGGTAMHMIWLKALMYKGFPSDTHNQSFMAFLTHALTSEPVHVISRYEFVVFGVPVLSPAAVRALGSLWGVGTMGLLLVTLVKFAREARFQRLAILVAAMIVPSHLVWKPYFLVGVPLAALAVSSAEEEGRREGWVFLGILFALVNCTSPDVVGVKAASYFEAYAVFLWCLLALMGWVWTRADLRKPLS